MATESNMRLPGTADEGAAETNLVRSALQHPILIALTALTAIVLALAVSATRSTSYSAEAGLLLQDPRSAALAELRPVRDQLRYAADQVAVLKSIVVAVRASVHANAESPKLRITPAAIQKKVTVNASETSNFVTIKVKASSKQAARIIANSVVSGYRDVVRASVAADNQAAVKRLDGAIASSVSRLNQLSQSGASEARRTDVESYLNVLRERRSSLLADNQLLGDGVGMFVAADTGSRDGLPTKTILAVALALGLAIGTALAYWLDARNPRIDGPLNAELVVGAPALAAIPDLSHTHGRSKLPVIDAAGENAAEIFRFVAFGLGLPRNRADGAGDEDEAWQANFPELTDRELTVLDLIAHGLSSSDAAAKLPGMTKNKVDLTVRAIQEKLGERDRDALVRRVQESGRSRLRGVEGGAAHLVAFCAAKVGDGTTTLLANTAIAAAQEGQRVLLVDCDTDNQGLTRLVFGRFKPDQNRERPRVLSLTDMLHGATVRSPARLHETSGGGTVSIVALNTAEHDPMPLFRSNQFGAALASLRDPFDLVFVDVPPVLKFAYAGPLLRSARTIVVVAPHKGELRALRYLRERLDLLDLQPNGFLYNFRPARMNRLSLPGLAHQQKQRPAHSRPVAAPAPTQTPATIEQKPAPAAATPISSQGRVVAASVTPARPQTSPPWSSARGADEQKSEERSASDRTAS